MPPPRLLQPCTIPSSSMSGRVCRRTAPATTRRARPRRVSAVPSRTTPTTSFNCRGEPTSSAATVATRTAGTVIERKSRRMGSSDNPPVVANCRALTTMEHGSRYASTFANGRPTSNRTGVPNRRRPTPNSDCTTASTDTVASSTRTWSVHIIAPGQRLQREPARRRVEHRQRSATDRDAPLLAADAGETGDGQPDHHRMGYRDDDLARVPRSDERQRAEYPLLRVAQPFARRADGEVRRGAVELEVPGRLTCRFLGGHALPGAVVDVVQAVEDAQVQDPCLVGDDLCRGDRSPKGARVDARDAHARQQPRRVHCVLVALRVERDVPATAVAVLDVHRRRAVADDVELTCRAVESRLRASPGLELVSHVVISFRSELRGSIRWRFRARVRRRARWRAPAASARAIPGVAGCADPGAPG